MNTLTIHLTDAQMSALQASADRRTMSVEELAEVMLGHELWQEGKARRREGSAEDLHFRVDGLRRD